MPIAQTIAPSAPSTLPDLAALAQLGAMVRAEFQATITSQSVDWLAEQPLTDADLSAVQAMEVALATSWQPIADFLQIETWLTSGFIPTTFAGPAAVAAPSDPTTPAGSSWPNPTYPPFAALVAPTLSDQGPATSRGTIDKVPQPSAAPRPTAAPPLPPLARPDHLPPQPAETAGPRQTMRHPQGETPSPFSPMASRQASLARSSTLAKPDGDDLAGETSKPPVQPPPTTTSGGTIAPASRAHALQASAETAPTRRGTTVAATPDEWAGRNKVAPALMADAATARTHAPMDAALPKLDEPAAGSSFEPVSPQASAAFGSLQDLARRLPTVANAAPAGPYAPPAGEVAPPSPEPSANLDEPAPQATLRADAPERGSFGGPQTLAQPRSTLLEAGSTFPASILFATPAELMHLSLAEPDPGVEEAGGVAQRRQNARNLASPAALPAGEPVWHPAAADAVAAPAHAPVAAAMSETSETSEPTIRSPFETDPPQTSAALGGLQALARRLPTIANPTPTRPFAPPAEWVASPLPEPYANLDDPAPQATLRTDAPEKSSFSRPQTLAQPYRARPEVASAFHPSAPFATPDELTSAHLADPDPSVEEASKVAQLPLNVGYLASPVALPAGEPVWHPAAADAAEGASVPPPGEPAWVSASALSVAQQPSLTDADLARLMQALAREIAHEYRRFYGG